MFALERLEWCLCHQAIYGLYRILGARVAFLPLAGVDRSEVTRAYFETESNAALLLISADGRVRDAVPIKLGEWDR